jgi:hypothetical protein
MERLLKKAFKQKRSSMSVLIESLVLNQLQHRQKREEFPRNTINKEQHANLA